MVEQRQVMIVGVCGFVGGIISYLYALTTVAGPLGQSVSWIVPILLYCLGGIAAALVGVFLLANTDRKDLIRLGATGLLFGIFWVQVLNQAGSSIAFRQASQAAQGANIQAEALTTDTGNSEEKVSALVKANDELFTKAESQISNPDVRNVVSESVVQSIGAIKTFSEKNPELAAKALTDIKELAETRNLPEVAAIVDLAKESIERPAP